jgi:hypothetical protein
MNQTKNRTAPFSLPNVERSHSVLKRWNLATLFLFAILNQTDPKRTSVPERKKLLVLN